ncbi:Avr1b-1 avirulence-like protein [Phytophthora sojae]|uniref:RxLR effector protein n=2 Tax=Phytophthora sojae TaxID=67593 RepID=G4ZKB9_PHYSP|nr:Avr1b-1 avirulence-like protein [Phytophthora sojae]AEK80609.1 Avh73 [Phytophthora sojae]AEK80610.1 Avh73 [Phytophthora sojae]AEK80611.1 Avh73 [Phytophthora sojae]EGZ15529.1 Avr1b-1 avirulence-like protein [Phytophthora sojae]|eukprot:XP_009529278.1 Avr1b-1 avirulence-like protein [Phytophthora sojae]
MHLSYVLLMVAATLLASNELVSAASASSELVASNARALRSHKTPSVLAAGDEERAAEERAAEEKNLDAKILAKILSDHAYAKQVFRSWLQNGQTKEDIENRLETQGLLTKYGSVVTQYGKYLEVLEGKAA